MTVPNPVKAKSANSSTQVDLKLATSDTGETLLRTRYECRRDNFGVQQSFNLEIATHD